MEAGELIGDALNKALSRSPASASPQNPPLFPQVIDDVFASFQKVMSEASQDKAQLLTIIASMSEEATMIRKVGIRRAGARIEVPRGVGEALVSYSLASRGYRG